jgi:hypothetical protein
MQDNRKKRSKRITPKAVLVLFGLMVLAYFPVSSFLFFLKNDAFQGYFPARYYFSEALHSNIIPWWNPYINYGLPQYGDMNSGFWSPITWLIGSTVGYNAYTFTMEFLLYLFLSGVGMFLLCRSFSFTRTVSYVCGFAFMCSGYMVGHLQHLNWLSGAAFLPWCIWGYHLLLHKFSYKNAVQSALLFYLLFSSAHPGLIIGSLYFFIAYSIFHFVQKKNDDGPLFSPGSFIRKHLWMMGILLVLSLGLIMGYADIIPHMTRGTAVSTPSTSNPFTIQSILSFLLPFSTTQADGFFNTDISMRNGYIGLLLLLFVIPAFLQRNKPIQRFLFYTALAFTVLSLGGYTRYVTQYLFPLSGYVRMPGEFLIFGLLALILMAGFTLNEHIREGQPFSSIYRKTIAVLQSILILALFAGLIGAIVTQDSIFFSLGKALSAPSFSGKFKALVDGIQFWDALWIQGLIQLMLINAFSGALKQTNYQNLIRLCAIDLALATLLHVPFTGVGKNAVANVQYAVKKLPEGILKPSMDPIVQLNAVDAGRYSSLLGNPGYYQKQIGFVEKPFYPVELKTSAGIYADDSSLFCTKPFLFSTGGIPSDSIFIKNFKGNYIELIINSPRTDTIVFQQNVYPHWRAVVNGEVRKPIAYNGVYNAAVIRPGRNDLKFNFNPTGITAVFQFCRYAFLICLLYLVIMLFRRPSP